MATIPDLADLASLGQISIRGIEVWAYHGVFDEERRDGQPFRVDLTWWQDVITPARIDDVTRTIDYAEVAMFVVKLLRAEPVNLIETLAVRVQDALLERFGMAAVAVTVHKPHAPLAVEFEDVSATTPVVARSRPDRTVVFSLGSNIEPRRDYLQFGVTALAATPGLDQVRVSPVYETAPQGVADQPDFLNAVVLARSALPALGLLWRGLQIEMAAHRTRAAEHGPRTLDIDLIGVGDETWDSPELTLPHPRAAHRAFVLVPWLDVAPAAHLGSVPASSLLAGLGDQRVTRWSDGLFLP